VAGVLSNKAVKACEQFGSDTLIVGGGFSANSELREVLQETGQKHGVTVELPRLALCTDNGAMVAMLGSNLVEAGVRSSAIDFPIDSSMPMNRIMA
jgi:N6-L-threonylcarbamoyladenine synthase